MKTTVLAVALASLSISAGAAGLGKLTVLSGLGQPLQAEVDLTATRDELSSMSARLAPPEAFKQAGIELTSALAGIKFSVAKREDGKPYLKLSSDRPISEPFLDMLIQLDWAQGRLLREYTFLLDPPEAVLGRQQIAPVAPPEVKEPGAAKQPEAPQGKTAAGTTREVKRGDTLRGIAQESVYDGVTVDQMLVAIFRANKGAFIGKNMNRLRAGVILNIPERDAVAGIAPRDARRVVAAQAASFNAYRRRVAAAAAAAAVPEEATPKQSAAGKITPRVEEKAAGATEQRDQLKVSKSDAAREAAKADKSAQTRLAALEEDIVAKDKALAEANSRVSDLEKNIKELQRLVELKSQTLAELQKQAAAGRVAAGPEAKKAESLPSPVPKPSVAVAEPQPSGAAPQAEAKPAAPSPGVGQPAPVGAQPAGTPLEPPKAAEKPAEPAKPTEAVQGPASQPVAPVEEKKSEAPLKPSEEAKKSATPVPAVEKPGFLASLLANPLALYGGGGALAALLGLLGYRMSRGRKEEAPAPVTTTGKTAAQSVFGATGGQSVDTSASSIQTDFSHSGMAAIDADEGVDPVAEADVYMAYGRDAQAEEILLDALKNEPTRHAIHVKLLEIYAQRKSLKQFETLASELYAQTGGVGAEWEKAAAMGRKLDSANPLYGGKASAESATPAPSAPGVIAGAVAAGSAAVLAGGAESKAAPGEAGGIRGDTWTVPGALNPVGGGSDSADAPTVAMLEPASLPTSGKSAGLDFNFELPTVEPAASADLSGKPGEGAGLDFDLGLDFAPAAEQAPEPARARAPDSAVLPEPVIHEKRAWEPEPAATQAADKGKAFAGTESLGARSVIDFDLGAAAEPEVLPIREAPKSDLPIMDLERTDVAGTLIDFNLDELTASKPSSDIAVMDLERTDVGGNLLDFNFELEEGAKRPAAQDTVPTLDLSGINLDLPEAGPRTGPMLGAETTVSMVPGQEPATGAEGENPEVATKIELAKAYEEMGDGEGARELLQEVLDEGSAAQKEQARELLAKLA